MCRPELLENLKGNEKVKIITNAEIQELKGSEYLDYAVVKVNDEIKEYPVQYAFMYLGTKNSMELYGEFAQLDEEGYIVTDEFMKTRTGGSICSRRCKKQKSKTGNDSCK